MPIGWNEIKSRAVAFSKEWQNESREHAESKTFWDGFFNVFGLNRYRVAEFEKPVYKLDHKQGFIDLLWKGKILVEHKSKGKNLDKAFQQAKDYFPGLKDYELPKYVLVSDFENFRLYNLENDSIINFKLSELVKRIRLFGFLIGADERVYDEGDPVNIKAALLMGKLHDKLEEIGYSGHKLEIYLVRLLFCLFADKTGIFNTGIFWQYIDKNTLEDGSDLAGHLAQIFNTLNTPFEDRYKNLEESLSQFEYINGKLFAEVLPTAHFDSKMRTMLLDACALDWGKISPAIFGSMFQAVMSPEERHDLGAHYTSEKNIQKALKSLFLDDLYKEFYNAKGNRIKLNELHKKISSMQFLDPACGCGNFLIITYRELRLLEIQILRDLYKNGTGFFDIKQIIKVDVNQFYGIEYDEFPVRISEVAMWLMDHQMNMEVHKEFGQYFVRLPLKHAAKIVHGNALQLDWSDIVVKDKLSFIVGNPPFKGKKSQSLSQKEDMTKVFAGVDGAGVLDYVSAWYLKAANLIQNSNIRCAFVSTNSIAQGEQVGILWKELYAKQIKIHFAHRTFFWKNEARSNAAVHVVIIGFGLEEVDTKYLYDYPDIKGDPQERKVKNINPYLVEGSNVVILKRRTSISNAPKISFGSMPNDGGNLLLTDMQKNELVSLEADSEKWIRPMLSSAEYLSGENRWCLWLEGIEPKELSKLRIVSQRVEKVYKHRISSNRKATNLLASYPTLFGENRQPKSDFILIPLHSSETRKYIPMGFFNSNCIVNNSCSTIGNASLFIFGLLMSEMHMVWVKYTCGRIKSDYRYSNEVVYNNYPFAQNASESNKSKVEVAAQQVLDVRANHLGSSPDDLYKPHGMPPDLVRAHQILDKAVDLCYRPQSFTNEAMRIEFLLNLYEQYSAPLLGKASKK